MTDQAPAGNGTRPALAEQHRAARAPFPPSHPLHPPLWPKLRPWLAGAAVGLALGAAAAFAVSYQVMPVRATHLERIFLTIDGRPAFLVSGDVVFDSNPLALSPTPAAQP